MQRDLHDVGRLWMLISNYGILGNDASCGFDSTDGYPGFISCRYPGESSPWDYLAHGALWVGAIVKGDTLVSCGFDGWIGELEMFPGSCEGDTIEVRSNNPSSPFYDPNARSNQDFYAACTDTLLYEDYEGVSQNHLKPLGIRVSHRSFTWQDPSYSDFTIIEYNIENKCDNLLEDVYLGLFFDGDCGPSPHDYASRRTNAQDDISGLHEFCNPDCDMVHVAWTCDYEREDSVGDTLIAPHVFAVTALRTPDPDMETTFNWWVSDEDAEIDWCNVPL
jgi:hypothetical protein